MAPLLTFAQNVSELQAQIQLLLAQIAQLKAQQAYSSTSTGSDVSCVVLRRDLSVDDTDAGTDGEVTKLQQFLARDPAMYPEGRVTGYFGPATMRAVQRYQKALGIVSSGDPDSTGYGFVGRRTRAAIATNCSRGPIHLGFSETDSPDKARDTRRISDIKQLQLTLELYFDTHQSYPTTLAALASGQFISSVPVDPLTSAQYSYAVRGASCGYHLGATLETRHSSLNSDADSLPSATVCAGSLSDFSGADPVYDVQEDGGAIILSQPGLSLALFSSHKSMYTPGENIRLVLSALELHDGTPATPEEGYNVQAFVSGIGDGYNTQGENVKYMPHTGKWETTELVSPMNSLKAYKVEISLYCANASLKCGSLFNSDPVQDKGQVNISFVFSLTTATNPLSIIAPSQGAQIQAGQIMDVKWTGPSAGSQYLIVVQDATGGRHNITNSGVGGVLATIGSYSWTVPQNYANGDYQVALFSGNGLMKDDSRLTDWVRFSIRGGAPAEIRPVISSTEAAAAGNFEMDAGGYATIYGHYLAGNLLNTTNVFIGGIRANVLSASDQALSISVPSTLSPGQTYDMYVSNEKGTSNTVNIKILSVRTI